MNVLITGGAGFIGSHLAEFMLARDASVAVLDDLSTGSMANIAEARRSPRFRHVIDSVLNRPVVAELVDEADVVFHLAAAVGVRLIVDRPAHTIESLVHGTELVLEAAAKKLKKVVLASSSEVYGKSAHSPYREDDDMVFGATTKSRWSYGCAKAIDEFLALAYHADAGLPVVVARLFNTVGPRQVGRYGMVLPRFVEQALADGPITVYDDGLQERCFTYVGDVVEALAGLAANEKAEGRVFNVGSETPVSMNDLAARVRDRVDPALEIVHIPYDVAYEAGFEDVRRRVPDCSRIRDLTGWEPGMDLDRIIDIVIRDRRAHRPEGGAAS